MILTDGQLIISKTEYGFLVIKKILGLKENKGQLKFPSQEIGNLMTSLSQHNSGRIDDFLLMFELLVIQAEISKAPLAPTYRSLLSILITEIIHTTHTRKIRTHTRNQESITVELTNDIVEDMKTLRAIIEENFLSKQEVAEEKKLKHEDIIEINTPPLPHGELPKSDIIEQNFSNNNNVSSKTPLLPKKDYKKLIADDKARRAQKPKSKKKSIHNKNLQIDSKEKNYHTEGSPSKLAKYFNQQTLPLVHAAVGTKKTGGDIKVDVALSPYTNSIHKRNIEAMISSFELEEIKAKSTSKVTHSEIISKIQDLSDASNIANNSIVKFACKVNVINNMTKKNVTKEKDGTTKLLNRKTLASQAIAKLAVGVKNTRQQLGFFGWVRHPMQAYRNNKANSLVKEMHAIQTISREQKKELSVYQWQLCVFKYYKYGLNASMTREGTNDPARRELEQAKNELEHLYQYLTNLNKNNQEMEITLIDNINETIDKLMYADARLQFEI